jgi:pimeloyl-ACP methyl ester carboxylesterase
MLAILLLRDSSFWGRSRRMRLARLAAFACYVYVGALLALLALEDRLLFPGSTVARPWREPPEHLHAREVTLTSARGDRIIAWFSAPEGWKPEEGAVLYSHGNGSNLSRISGRAFRWHEPLGRAVLLYDYPGYGKSSGRPSEAGCYEAGEAAFRWLVEEQKVPEGEVILVGESLGGAIATELATRHAGRLLVLLGAFTSFPDMAQTRFPFFPGRYLVHNRMDNEAKIGQARCPVLISHGTADTVVPYRQGERLYAAAREPKRFLRLEGWGHGRPDKAALFPAVKAFLEETAR